MTCSMEFLLLLSQGGQVFLAELPFLRVSQKMLPTAALRPIISLPPAQKLPAELSLLVSCGLPTGAGAVARPVAPHLFTRLPVPWQMSKLAQVLASHRSFRWLPRNSLSHTHTNQFQCNPRASPFPDSCTCPALITLIISDWPA